ncbi:MAG: efflux RND transporter periplasmic adaptor subunit [Spirochaetes bacterium]|nr:efflux RND transporter periplasmic adaptor subunit [Spirochaetota bacterium]
MVKKIKTVIKRNPIKGLKNFKKWDKKRKIKTIVISVVVLIIIMRIMVGIAGRSKKKDIVIIKIPVEAAIAKTDTIREVVYITERLQALSDVNVMPPVSGWVHSLNVDIGSRVSKYQVVATINRNIVGSEYVNAIVKAPISGEVGRIHVDKGATVSPATPIMNIINYDLIKIYVNIPEKFSGRVKKGDTALIRMEAQKNEEYIGTIEKVSSMIDAMTGTFQAKIMIPNRQHRLKPGSFANIKVVLNIEKGVIIPKDALIETEGIRPYVYKSVDHKALKVYIEKGIEEDENVEIVKGIQENDIVITIGKEIVKQGSELYIANAKDLGIATEATNIKNEEKKSDKKGINKKKEQTGLKKEKPADKKEIKDQDKKKDEKKKNK